MVLALAPFTLGSHGGPLLREVASGLPGHECVLVGRDKGVKPCHVLRGDTAVGRLQRTNHDVTAGDDGVSLSVPCGTNEFDVVSLELGWTRLPFIGMADIQLEFETGRLFQVDRTVVVVVDAR